MDFDRNWPAADVVIRPLAELRPDPENARTHSDDQIEQVAGLIREYGWAGAPILVDETDLIIAGHGRLRAATERVGLTHGPVMVARGWTAQQKRAFQIADNQVASNSAWDISKLSVHLSALQGGGLDLMSLGFAPVTMQSLFGSAGQDGGGAGVLANVEEVKRKLADRFGIPPFSVLNAREGWWQDRKSAWIALGIQSEIGRGENLLKMSDTMLEPDPVKRAAAKARKEAAGTLG